MRVGTDGESWKGGSGNGTDTDTETSVHQTIHILTGWASNELDCYLNADVVQLVVAEVVDADVTSPLDWRQTAGVDALSQEKLKT